MKQRLSLLVSSIAALLSVAVLLGIVLQLDATRRALQRHTVLEYSFIHQTDHNLDKLYIALSRLQFSTPQTREALTREAIESFDVVYSLHGTAHRQSGAVKDIKGAEAVMTRLDTFISQTEPYVTPHSLYDVDRLQRMIEQARSLSQQVYALGTTLNIARSRTRDGITTRMDRLITLFWFFGGLFLLAGLSLVLLVRRALRESARLATQADSSRLQLETALEELTSGDVERKAQNRFLAAATHDLRQPLQAQQYYLTALESHVKDQPGQDILRNVARATDATQSMLNSLLDISRLDAGVLEPDIRPVDVDAMLERLEEEFAVEATERGLTWRTDRVGVWVLSDHQSLTRILRNLIANAFAHTRQGGVAITGEVLDDKLQLRISDTGAGIPQQELQSIFNEFYQVPGAESSAVNGLGLGLSIVRHLTRLLDIPIDVESDVGQGTRFDLQLTTTPALDKIVVRSEGRVSSRDGLNGLAVMIIDDDEGVRHGVETMLLQLGCEVMSAAGADDALRRLVASEVVPDLMLADHQLIGSCNGLEAIQIMRDEVNEHIPAVLITGDTSPDRVREAERINVPVLHKPVVPDVLFARIDEVLSSSAAFGNRSQTESAT